MMTECRMFIYAVDVFDIQPGSDLDNGCSVSSNEIADPAEKREKTNDLW